MQVDMEEDGAEDAPQTPDAPAPRTDQPDENRVPSDDEALFKKYPRASWCKFCRAVKLAFHTHKSNAKNPAVHEPRDLTASELRSYLEEQARAKEAKKGRKRQAARDPAANPPAGQPEANTEAAPDVEEYHWKS